MSETGPTAVADVSNVDVSLVANELSYTLEINSHRAKNISFERGLGWLMNLNLTIPNMRLTAHLAGSLATLGSLATYELDGSAGLSLDIGRQAGGPGPRHTLRHQDGGLRTGRVCLTIESPT